MNQEQLKNEEIAQGESYLLMLVIAAALVVSCAWSVNKVFDLTHTTSVAKVK